jgi:hypothetical protein
MIRGKSIGDFWEVKVSDLRESAIEVPRKREAAGFVVLETAELLNEAAFKLWAQPRTELEGDILVGIRAAVPSGGCGQSFGVVAVNPSLGGEEKAVPAHLISNSLEFEGIKIRVVNLFPDPEEEPSQIGVYSTPEGVIVSITPDRRSPARFAFAPLGLCSRQAA